MRGKSSLWWFSATATEENGLATIVDIICVIGNAVGAASEVLH